MGSEFLATPTQTQHKTNLEGLEEACPMYMAMGMTLDEYWNGDPVLAKYYRKAYAIKREKENEDFWLQGMYFYDALSTVIHNALKSKNEKARNYTEKPYDFKKEKTEEDKAKEVQIEQEKAYAWMDSFVRMFSNKSQSHEPEPMKRGDS